jgi:ABC-type nitrate/sulfonate/bicarbonate transport system substrate-binding protein
MSTSEAIRASNDIDQLWFTRCTVPTAAGIAYGLGWLDEEFAADGITLSTLQDAAADVAGGHHFSHGLIGLIREGGSIPAFWTRSIGTPTRVLGLTWVDEKQVVVARPGSGITGPSDLRGRTAAVAEPAPRAPSVHRPMALKGLLNALSLGGLSLDDIEIVNVPSRDDGSGTANWGLRPELAFGPWPGLNEVAEGRADIAYAKGALAAEQIASLGLEVVVNLDDATDARFRVNNGTPRPITVRQELLDQRPDLVVRFLVRILESADWAATHVDEVLTILATETGSQTETARRTYTGGFHEHLHPTLSPERVALFEDEKRFLVDYSFIEHDFELSEWFDPEPLAEAVALVSERANLLRRA